MEIDYEKAYKAALETATQWIKDGCTDKERICLESAFPQLRESKDERMRKAALEGIEYLERDCGWDVIGDIDILDVKEYLEKQKINTEGDFAMGYDCGYQCCLNSHGAEWFEKQKEQKPIFKKGDKVIWQGEEFNILDVNGDSYNVGGYILPFHRQNELSLVEQRPAEITPNQFDGITYGMKGYSSEKPAACADDVVEEAEEYTSKVACGEYGVEVTEAYIAGVLSERNRGTEWSEFDKGVLEDAICATDLLGNDESFNKSNPNLAKAFRVAKDWLKSLRPQPHTVSIKDATKFGNLEYERGVKDGIQSEKNRHWKPSEEQMEVYTDAIYFLAKHGFKDPNGILESLYSDLKKLM